MDKQTYEYMKERVDKYKQNLVTIQELNNVIHFLTKNTLQNLTFRCLCSMDFKVLQNTDFMNVMMKKSIIETCKIKIEELEKENLGF